MPTIFRPKPGVGLFKTTINAVILEQPISTRVDYSGEERSVSLRYRDRKGLSVIFIDIPKEMPDWVMKYGQWTALAYWQKGNHKEAIRIARMRRRSLFLYKYILPYRWWAQERSTSRFSNYFHEMKKFAIKTKWVFTEK